MKFGAMIAPKADDWGLVCELEQWDFDAVWVADSHMIWSNCYAILALAAANTSRIRLGTGVTNPVTRTAPVTANAIATINQLAPGRVFLGIGTGFSSLLLMGMSSAKLAEFREYLRVLRALLGGEAVDYKVGPDEVRRIAFLDTDQGFLNTENRVPIFVAANGPLALKAAGEFGDGCITVGDSLSPGGDERVAERIALIAQGAHSAGRTVSSDFHVTSGSFSCLLQPGETTGSERVIDQIGAIVACNTLHTWWEMARAGLEPEKFVPDYAFALWERYLALVDARGTDPSCRHLDIHRGHATYLLPDERQFITPELIRAAGGLVGPADEIIEGLRVREKAGIREVTIMASVDRSRESFREFSEQVIARY